MRKRSGYLALVAGAAVGGALLVGGSAQSQTTASIVASTTENTFKTAAGGAPEVPLPAGGGIVGFSYAGSPGRFHNVVFKNLSPAACTQTQPSGPSGAVPPLPNPASDAAWAGTCTFTTPGTYTFYCVVHGEGMNGSVTVPGTTTPPPPPPVAPPPPPPVSPPPPPPPVTGPAASLLRVTNPQRSFTLRGSVNVSRASSRLLARAFARRGALTGGRSTVLVQVGRQLRSSVGPGRVSFSLPLSAVGRRALRRNGRLAITFRLTVDPPTGTTYTATRTVILRAP